MLVDPESVGATLVRANRGGDVTYHGPGQLVGYPIVDVPMHRAAIPHHVHTVEQVVIDTLRDCGIHDAARRPGYPGVWVGDAKIGAVGVRITRGRSMHGFALNVDPDLSMFDHIVPCGIRGLAVTSMAALGQCRDRRRRRRRRRAAEPRGAGATARSTTAATLRTFSARWLLLSNAERAEKPRAGAPQAARCTGTFEKPATFDICTRRSPSSSTS